jgi:3-dehydroquinate synthase
MDLILIPAGEIHKNIQTCELIWGHLLHNDADRKALLINLGGGVIGDMGGFCASTYKRGIDFVQIPTTLLSQVDASIGGKLGIDFGSIKNSIGVFCNPQAVLVDSAFLDTLSPAERRSGFAEIIKHCLIADAEQWLDIKTLHELNAIEDWNTYIVPSLHIKKRVVEADPFEKGLRKALNFGHTIGHAIEAISGYGKFLHGEAISIGQVAAARLSERTLGFAVTETARLRELFVRAGLPVQLSLNRPAVEKLMAATRLDKKVAAGEIRFVLARKIGLVEHGHKVPEGLVREVVVSMGAQ